MSVLMQKAVAIVLGLVLLAGCVVAPAGPPVRLAVYPDVDFPAGSFAIEASSLPDATGSMPGPVRHLGGGIAAAGSSQFGFDSVRFIDLDGGRAISGQAAYSALGGDGESSVFIIFGPPGRSAAMADLLPDGTLAMPGHYDSPDVWRGGAVPWAQGCYLVGRGGDILAVDSTEGSRVVVPKDGASPAAPLWPLDESRFVYSRLSGGDSTVWLHDDATGSSVRLGEVGSQFVAAGGGHALTTRGSWQGGDVAWQLTDLDTGHVRDLSLQWQPPDSNHWWLQSGTASEGCKYLCQMVYFANDRVPESNPLFEASANHLYVFDADSGTVVYEHTFFMPVFAPGDFGFAGDSWLYVAGTAQETGESAYIFIPLP